VVGVILSGTMDDGVAGLLAIRRCRGVTVVQDPLDAAADELPRNALDAAPEHLVPADEIAPLLTGLVQRTVPAEYGIPSDLALEAHAAAAAMTDSHGLKQLAEPTHLSCPECQGPLWRLEGPKDEHYRCEVGHAYSPPTLYRDQGKTLERALWVAYRTLTERARLLERMVQHDRARGMASSAGGFADRLSEVQAHAKAVLAALSAADAPELLEPDT
jgi:two-component system chemotaxis response regulator CheB